MALGQFKPTGYIPFENLDDPSPVQVGRGVSGAASASSKPGGAFGAGASYIRWELLDDPSPVQLGYGISGYVPPAAPAAEGLPAFAAGMKNVFLVVGVLALAGAAAALIGRKK